MLSYSLYSRFTRKSYPPPAPTSIYEPAKLLPLLTAHLWCAGRDPHLHKDSFPHVWISSEPSGIYYFSLSGSNEAAADNLTNGVEFSASSKPDKLCQEGEVAKCKLSVLRLWLCFGWSYHFWYVLCPALWAAWCMVSNPASWAASNASVMEKWTVTPEEKDYLLIPLRWWMGPVKPAVLLGRASFFWGSAGCLARIPPVALQSLGFGTDIAVRTETTPLNF